MNPPSSRPLFSAWRRRITFITATALLLPLTALGQAVTQFDENGWNADDVRDASNNNIVNATSHGPAPGAVLDDEAMAERLSWMNSLVTFGNLGGLRFDPSATAAGKATLSNVDTATGFGVLGTVANDPGFGVVYSWNRNVDITPGLGFKVGVQTTAFADSQNAFTASRTGESTWDLLLVYDPTNNGNSAGTRPTQSVIDLNTGVFNLFAQIGNDYWADEAGEAADRLGVNAQNSRTLAEWLEDEFWGDILADALITNAQFGMGSGNAGAQTTLDWAQISFLNGGEPIHFVDAVRYTGDGATPSAWADAANWGGTAPDANTNLVVESGATLEVTGAQSARSVGALAGTSALTLAPGSVLTLNPAENGTLSAFRGALLEVDGDGTLVASVIEAGGRIDFSAAAELDGGASAHPVRDGGPAATSRYAIVVHGGGELNLLDGADVTVLQTGRNVGVRIGEGPGGATLNLGTGASLEVGGDGERGFVHVGDWSSPGTLNQTGGALTVTGAMNIGHQGGDGEFNLSGGTFTFGANDPGAGNSNQLAVGRTTDSTARPTTGVWNISGDAQVFLVNPAGADTYVIIGGTDATNTAGSVGVINQTGGVVTVDNGVFFGGGYGDGDYNLDGGVLRIGGANGLRAGFTGGTFNFNLGGGTLLIHGSSLTTSAATRFTADTVSFINTDGFDATFNGVIGGAGTLVKLGEGDLTFTAAGSEIGAIAAFEGGVRQTTGSMTTGGLFVGSYGTDTDGVVDLTGGTMNVFAGSIAIGSGAGNNTGELRVGGTAVLNVGDDANPDTRVDLYVGAFNGASATLTQTGGTVNLNSTAGPLHVGNQASGTYDLSGGVLNVNRNAMVLGRSTESGVGTGVFNISGGEVNFASGTYLTLGGVDGDASNLQGVGSGTVNQSGGVVNFESGAYLALGTKGEGTYNLEGGELRVGGANGIRTFQGTGVLNLGGGTLTVTGSDLTTSVDIAAVADSVSTLDTNGFNATLAGGVQGDGELLKVGDGDLLLGASTLGGLEVAAGAVQLNGALTAAELALGEDGELRVGLQTVAVTGDADLAGRVVIGIGGEDSHGAMSFGGGLAFTGQLSVELLNAFTVSLGDLFPIFTFTDAGAVDLSLLTFDLPDLTALGLTWNLSDLELTGELSVVPEPSSYALLAGLVGLLGALARRRRR